jgi:hypothetical protein
MQSSNKIAVIGAIIGLLTLAVTIHPALAGGGISDPSNSTTVATGDTTTPITTPTPVPTLPSAPTPTNTSTSIVPAQYNQSGSGVQVNYSGSSTLSPPSCNGGCVFAVTRVSPATDGSNHNLEAMVGVTIPIGSNDGGVGEVNRVNAEMHKYRSQHEIKLALSEKLSEALENGKMERAKVIAMMLAPLLGYKDYEALLIAVSSPKPTQPQIGNR